MKYKIVCCALIQMLISGTSFADKIERVQRDPPETSQYGSLLRLLPIGCYDVYLSTEDKMFCDKLWEEVKEQKDQCESIEGGVLVRDDVRGETECVKRIAK